MKLYSSKSIEQCSEEECELHYAEIDRVFRKLRKIENYRCAVIEEPLDLGNRFDKKIDSIGLHDLKDILEEADCKNGCDLMIDDSGEYLIIVTYGQGYTLDDEYHQCVTAHKILPIKDDHFLDVVSFLEGGEVQDAENQYTQLEIPSEWSLS